MHDARYKAATRITGRELVLQLLECCDEELRKDLTRTAGGSLADRTEAEVLAAIKQLAVREENVLLARVELYNMRQDAGEEIRIFGARIRGQANLRKFTIPCSVPGCAQEVNYMDQILRDVLILGIADQDIRLNVLQDKNQDMSLEEAFQFIEAKEAGKRSASRLQDNVEVYGVRASNYRRSQRTPQDPPKLPVPPSPPPPKPHKDDKCSLCGNTGHGVKSPPAIHQGQCPTYNSTCTFCGIKHHYESLCRKKLKAIAGSTNNTVTCTDELYDCPEQLCCISS